MTMNVEILARLQFAITIMFHYIYPPLSIGLGVVMVVMEALYLKTKKPLYLISAKFWTKVFALTFAMGVATGIVMEFEFGTNWATYSRYVGDVFGSALAAEGVFAFFLESGFLALLLFGWNRVGPKLHFFSTLMVCLGAHFSAIWIVVANSWMQTPAGYEIVGQGIDARAHITSFWEMVLNPSSMTRLGHVLIGCWLAGAFLVMSVSAFYLLKKRHIEFAKISMKIGLSIALVACLLQLVSGDRSAKIAARYQPAKFAALEAVYKTQKGAPLSLFGIVSNQEEKVIFGASIPKFLSFLTHGDSEAEIKGLDQFPRKDWPHVSTVFQAYHVMIYMWGIMFTLTLIGIYHWWRESLYTNEWLLRCLLFAVLCPQIGNQVGWLCAEMGRYPWIVQDLLRISDGLSKAVKANQVLGSIILFGLVYFFLLVLFIYLLDQKIRHGPEDQNLAQDVPYRALHTYVKEIKNELS